MILACGGLGRCLPDSNQTSICFLKVVKSQPASGIYNTDSGRSIQLPICWTHNLSVFECVEVLWPGSNISHIPNTWNPAWLPNSLKFTLGTTQIVEFAPLPLNTPTSSPSLNWQPHLEQSQISSWLNESTPTPERRLIIRIPFLSSSITFTLIIHRISISPKLWLIFCIKIKRHYNDGLDSYY